MGLEDVKEISEDTIRISKERARIMSSWSPREFAQHMADSTDQSMRYAYEKFLKNRSLPFRSAVSVHMEHLGYVPKDESLSSYQINYPLN